MGYKLWVLLVYLVQMKKSQNELSTAIGGRAEMRSISGGKNKIKL